jgi:hypothetical protein
MDQTTVSFLSNEYLPGSTAGRSTIQSSMKQPADQQERNEDNKKPEKENPSHGIDPKSKEPEMEVEEDPGERQKKNQNQTVSSTKICSCISVALSLKESMGPRTV